MLQLCAIFRVTSHLANSNHLSQAVKTGSSQWGPDKGGKCDSVGLSVVCPSKVAMICSVVVAVT